ncbi:MAG: hypothetical protein GY804_03455 [Alphaproteobacteria bacterium]|nr:hypothetical protein [Alphaproteobacteria bacterium]
MKDNVNMPRKFRTLKARLRNYLPAKIAGVVSSYDAFTSETMPKDAKGFTAHHSACKAAIAHTDMLIKLAKWVEEEAKDENSESMGEDDVVGRLVLEAREGLFGEQDQEEDFKD